VRVLRDGTASADPRLDRLISFDERSRSFPLRLADAPKLPRHDRLWRLARSKYGDQGREGACTEFGISHELGATPVAVPTAELRAIRARHLIYWPAQENDEWPGGSYPGADPQYEGTSVTAAMAQAKALGYYDEYRWAFTDDDRVDGVIHDGPAVCGCWYTEGMFQPHPSGLVEVSGQDVGGHCMAWIGVRFAHKLPGEARMDIAILAQSWGTDFGDHGRIYVKLEDWLALLMRDGETAWGVGRHQHGQLPKA
jgi:hypothetical protein